MEQVTIDTAINVTGGPLVKLNAEVKSDAYVVASLALTSTGAGKKGDVTILPATGKASLLVIEATKDKDQTDATVTVTPSVASPPATATFTTLEVTGSLLVASPDVIKGLVAGGGQPEKLSVENKETEDVTVSIIAAFS